MEEKREQPQDILERFNRLAEQSRTIIWEIDQDGLYTAVSENVFPILGYKPAELVGKRYFYDLFPAERRQEFKADAFATIAQERPFYTFENPLQTKSGEIVWVSSDGIPLFDAAGNLCGYWGADMDITAQKQSEVALRESERRYRLLAENVTDVIWTMDLNLNSTYTSPSVQRLRGYDSATAMAQSLAETLTTDSLAIVAQVLAEELALEKLPDKEPDRWRILHLETTRRDGSIVPTETTVTFLRNTAGRPVEILGVTRDISERQRTAERLRASEANLKAILENSLESVWSINRAYEIQYVNEVFAAAFENSFGVKLRPGINILESLPAPLRTVWKVRYDRVLNNEHYIFRDKVELAEDAIYIEVAANPILLDGQVVGASFYGRDTTAQVLANEQLRYESELRKLLIELSTDFINLPLEELSAATQRSLAMLGEFVGVDRAYLFVYDFSGQRAANTYEWCAADITPEIDNLQNVPFSFVPNWLAAHQRGEPFWVPDVQALPDEGPDCLRGILEPQGIQSLIALPMIGGDGLLGFVGFDSVKRRHTYTDYERQLLQLYAQMLVNVRERQQAEEQMRRTQEDFARLQKLESIGALAGGIAHDFNNLLMGLFGNLNLARRLLAADHPARHALGRADQAMERATRLTHQLLTFAKGGAPVREACDIGLLTVETVRFDLSGSAALPDISYPPDLWSVAVDKGQIQQAISNLAINAMQAMPAGGRLRVSLQNRRLAEHESGQLPAGRYVRLEMSDEGMGISPDYLQRIFDPYFTTKQAGSGLGLAVVHSIIQKHGGHISVASQLEKGATFTLYLPAAPEETAVPGNSHVGEAAPAPSAVSVLILDDDEILRSGVADLLEMEGYEVATAATGETAVALYQQALIEERPFAIAVMDLTIPGGMGGLETVQAILALDPQARCIVSSGYADDPALAYYADYGFSAAIKKPYGLADLIAIIERLVHNSAALKPVS
jgi:PAS domain S-box-containing protein